jgi:hypothetical protein
MLNTYATRFDVTKNFKIFLTFGKTKQGLNGVLFLSKENDTSMLNLSLFPVSST